MKALITSIMLSAILMFPQGRSLQNKVYAFNLHNFIKNKALHGVEADIFVGSFTMVVTETKKGEVSKNSPSKIRFNFKDNVVAMEPEMGNGQRTTMIYNLEEKAVTTLITKDDKKTGIKIKMPSIKIDEEEGGQFDYKITPTTETKTIEGYPCKKYLFESDENEGYAWITDKIEIDFEKTFDFLNIKKNKNSNKIPSFGDIKGFAMESYTKSKTKDEEWQMSMTNVKVGTIDEGVFDTSEYKITDMSSMMDFGE